MKVYNVVYHDYEEHTTKYVCATRELAEELAKQLIHRDHKFNPTYQNNPTGTLYPTWVVNEFDVLESIDNVMPIPKYIRLTVEYIDKGITLADRLDIKNPGPENMYYNNELLPSFAKNINIIVSSSKTPETNDLEFGLYIPVSGDDIDSMRAKATKLIVDALNDISQKGHPLSYILHTDVRNFNPELWHIEYMSDWYLACTTIPNVLMVDAKIVDDDDDSV